MTMAINLFFTLLSLFHLAYLGVMFGVQSEIDDSLQAEVRLTLVFQYVLCYFTSLL